VSTFRGSRRLGGLRLLSGAIFGDAAAFHQLGCIVILLRHL
jgi:hypothetical protein